ncbi:hypothetical protein BDZ85DRAFT_293180 [Elsinoe ampelina]|uniref:DUF7730 domain-containing protein n=1 Tax=Elsinoe ampelina TaxID=302913 RepID=A0A6A6GR62_9PEZI|nr:hypothetical protein BDZ85DRAFT_293180 [Elsinoe ampelina]
MGNTPSLPISPFTSSRTPSSPPASQDMSPSPSPPPRKPLHFPPDQINPQASSTLFSLPPEIRSLIFHLAIGRGMIHLDMVDDVPGKGRDEPGRPGEGTRVVRFPCFEEGRGRNRGGMGRGKRVVWKWKHSCWVMKGSVGGGGTAAGVERGSVGVGGVGWDQESGASVLGLLGCCRRGYQEALPVLYGTNTFDFQRFESILGLFQVVPQEHINMIRHVRLFVTLLNPPPRVQQGGDVDLYDEVWKLLGTMEGLKELKVCMAIHMAIGHIMRNREAYLAPLRRVKGVNCFECYLPPDTSQLPEQVKQSVPGCRVAGWDVWKR